MTELADRSAVLGRAHPSLRRRMRRFVSLVFVADLLALLVTAWIGVSGRQLFDDWLGDTYLEFSVLNELTPWLFLMWLACLVGAGCYETRILGGGTEEFRRVAMATGLAAAAFSTLGFLTRHIVSRGYVIVCFIAGTLILIAVRYALRRVLHRLRRQGRMSARVVAVCSPDALQELVESLDRAVWSGLTVVGVCLPERHLPNELEGLPVPVLGGPGEVVEACAAAQAEVVLVGGGGHESSQALRRIGWELEGHDIELVVVPGLIDVAGPRMHVRQVGGLPLVHVDKPKAGRASGMPKRTFDVLVASTMLLFLAVPMLCIAAVIKLMDRGPVFYRQERTGRGDDRFQMLKFRSMVADADRRLDDLVALNDADEVLFKMRDDPRITPIGKILRKFSLDELPQLINVLRGDMSMVGPRPPLPREVEDYPVDMRRRLLVRPGLTGLWQVSGRSDLPFAEAVRMDLYYVDNWSIVGDVIIMLKTVRAVVSGSGAY